VESLLTACDQAERFFAMSTRRRSTSYVKQVWAAFGER
jgi:hypothetical protein